MTAIDTAKALVFTGGTIPTSGASAGDLDAEIAARILADNDIIYRGGKIFATRAEAVSFSQAKLLPAYGRIVTIEDAALVVRAVSQTSDDPLFETYPQWGAILRVDVRGMVSSYAGGDNPSGLGISQNVDFLLLRNNTANTYTFWRRVVAPPDGLETDVLKVDANGRWWRRLEDMDLVNIRAEIQASIDRDRALHSFIELMHQGDTLAGDPLVEAQDATGSAVSFYDGQGRLVLGDLVTHGHFSGDDAFPIITDRDGRPLVWALLDVPRIGMADIDWSSQSFAGFDWSAAFSGSFAGDPIVFLEDAGGNALIYVDDKNRFVGAGGGGGARPNISFSGPVWNATDDGTSRRWGTRYHGRYEGMEERGGLTLAETGPVAVGMIGYGGGGASMSRPMAEDWRYHIRTPVLSYDGGMQLAEAHCSASAQDRLSRDLAVPTMIAITAAIGSPVASDTAVGSPLYGGVMSGVAQAAASLAAWGKSLVVDRVSMSLLGGAPDTSQIAADNEYASIAAALRADISTTTGQGTPPLVVVSPSFGTREGGSTAVSLAEARLDASHPALGFVVAGPRHAYDLLSGSLVALTPESAALQTELEAIAVREVQAGNLWYCPILVSASLSGSVITANFASMSDLELPSGGEHGFSVSGITNGAAIASVAVSGRIATITLSEAPQGSLTLNLAWGRSGTPSDARPINRSDIRDLWSEQSRQIADHTHYRLALPSSVAISA